MIDRQVFGREFSVLLERFGRAGEVGDELIRRYLEFLDSQLSTQEFELASRTIFEEDQFFPSPRRFVDVVKGNAKDLAERDWQHLQQLVRDNAGSLDSMSPTARAALKAAGGWAAVAFAADEFALRQAKRAFLDAHISQATAPSRPQIAAQEHLELGVAG